MSSNQNSQWRNWIIVSHRYEPVWSMKFRNPLQFAGSGGFGLLCSKDKALFHF